jgi:aspartate aminotransferase
MISCIDAELEALLEAQETYDRRYKEWTRRAGGRVCDFTYANPYGGPSAEVIAAIADALRASRTLDLQYTPYGGATITRRLVADRLSETHGEAFHWRDVVMTPGAMAALNVVFRFLRSGEGPHEVIVPTPCWMDYPLYLVHLGLKPVLVPLDRTTLRLDLDRIQSALGPRTRAIVLSQPANPTGIVYSGDELRALAGLLESAGGHNGARPWIISDEAHRDLVFEPAAFVSPLKCYDRTLIVYSFGKSLAIQGQRIGYVAISPRVDERDRLAEELERLCRMMGFCTPTALMQLAVRRLVSFRPDVGALVARRDRVMAALTSCGYEVPQSQGTFFLYPRSPEPDECRFVEALADHGVLVLPARLFHDRGHFRIALTASDEMIDRSLSAFQAVIGRSTS